MRRIIILLVLSIACGFQLHAQNSTQGKEFWFTFMQNGYKYNGGGWVSNRVMISAKKACTGTIRKLNGGWAGIDFSVQADGITIIDIPEEFAYNEFNEETVDDKALVLMASDTVSVYICNIATNSFDASFVLPVESLGSEYIVQAFEQSPIIQSEMFVDQLTSCFVVVAVEDNTIVEVTPSVATTLTEAGNTQTVELSKGETYFVRSNYDQEDRDLSGSMISSHDGKKIAVFNGNTLTAIPFEMGNGLDHIFEQALPIDSWGKQFVVTSSQSRVRDFVKITSSADGNVVRMNGDSIVSLDAGESYVFYLLSSDGSCFIETTVPSMVYLYNTTSNEPFEPSTVEYGDPSMVWIPPVEQRIGEVTFCTFNHDDATIDNHFVNIVVGKEDIHRVYLDGVLIDPDLFQPVIGNGDYYYLKKEIQHGTHHLSCISGVIAHVYGFGYFKGYGYCVGANVIDLTTQLFVNGSISGLYPHGLFVCKDETVELSIVTNYHVDQVDWYFDDGQTATGEAVAHQFTQKGDYETKACIKGFNTVTQQTVFDTLSLDVHVGEPNYYDETHILCNEDSFDYYGILYTESGHYERVGTDMYGCDSVYYLTLDLGFSPDFEFIGNHYPIGGTETHISLNEYEIQLVEERTLVDTVLWEIDCPNWYVTPHGKGMSCTLSIFTFLLEPVMLHATAINRCDTIHKEFFIKTSYYDLPEQEGNTSFEIGPNPSNGTLNLHFHGLKSEAELTLFNSVGQQLDALTVDADRLVYVMPDLDNGFYYLMMRCDGIVLVRKVVLLR